MSLSVNYSDETTGDRDHKISHLAAGMLSLRVIDGVLTEASKIIDSNQCRILRQLWSDSLREIEGVPLATQVDTATTSLRRDRLNEVIEPITAINGREGKPSRYMVKPVLAVFRSSSVREKLSNISESYIINLVSTILPVT